MDTALLNLLHITDSTLPIGGFSHSAGLETYVQKQIVKDKATAKDFITEMLSRNLRYTDAALLSLCFDAASKQDIERIVELDAVCTAVKLPMEMRQASKKLGMRLLKIFNKISDNRLLEQFNKRLIDGETTGNYCIVFALIANVMQIQKEAALQGFYYNAAAGFVTNSVKLIPLGQQEGQEILFSFLPLINQLTAATMQPDEGLIGLCCPGFDLSSMQHEQLYSRLYMS